MIGFFFTPRRTPVARKPEGKPMKIEKSAPAELKRKDKDEPGALKSKAKGKDAMKDRK